MVRYNDAKFDLKFLGTMNGDSSSHTNAYFYPEKDVIAFIDLSLLNLEKARELIKPNLRRVILFLTHLHVDHSTGVPSLACFVREQLKSRGVLLEIVTGSHLLREAAFVFYAMGGKPIIQDGRLDEMFRIYGQSSDGKFQSIAEAAITIDQDFLPEKQRFRKPEWFIEVVPTIHSMRLSGAFGFVFKLGERIIVYSGDTNTFNHFSSMVNSFSSGSINSEPKQVDFYLESQYGEAIIPIHLSFVSIRQKLMSLMKRCPQLRVVIMHYESDRIRERVYDFNRELGDERLFVAEEEET